MELCATCGYETFHTRAAFCLLEAPDTLFPKTLPNSTIDMLQAENFGRARTMWSSFSASRTEGGAGMVRKCVGEWMSMAGWTFSDGKLFKQSSGLYQFYPGTYWNKLGRRYSLPSYFSAHRAESAAGSTQWFSQLLKGVWTEVARTQGARFLAPARDALQTCTSRAVCSRLCKKGMRN